MGAIVAVAGAIIQAVTVLSTGDFLESLGTFIMNLIQLRWDQLPLSELTGFFVIVIGFGIFYTLRYTSFLMKESQEPFRYTFWVEPFAYSLNDSKGAPPKEQTIPSIHSRFSMLHHGIRERLNQRIKRFKLLEVKDSNSDKEALASHINIRGEFAVKEEVPDKWVIYVTSSVRIGPKGSPETLAYPIAFPIEPKINKKVVKKTKNGAKWNPIPGGLFLAADEYNQIVERVYSSIATEIYRQILSDVKNKINLFPGNYLRNVALFYEAKDFERSNTLDSYDYALELYREAERYFDRRLSKWKDRLFQAPLLWRLTVKSQLMEARTRIGYSRCLYSKRKLSAQSGRNRNTVFEAKEELDLAIKSLIALHNLINNQLKIEQLSDNEEIRKKTAEAFLTFPNDSVLNRDRPYFDKQRQTLFDAFTVGSLVYSDLGSIQKAKDFLDNAKAVDPVLYSKDPLWLLAASKTKSNLSERLSLVTQATEIAPTFQIAQYELADISDTKLRLENEISKERIDDVIEEYEKVLTINPGNIGALANQGYLFWLRGELDKAKKKFEIGINVKTDFSQTFVGEFIYGLARLAAENRDYSKSHSLYLKAVSSDPDVASCQGSTAMTSSYYSFMAEAMLERYRQFKENVETDIKKQLEKIKTNSSKSTTQNIKYDEKIWKKTLHRVRSFVLNDFGNACLNYFWRSGDYNALEDAINAFRRATKIYDQNAVAFYNLKVAFEFKTGKRYEDQALHCLEEATRLLPSWSTAIFALATFKATLSHREITKIKKRLKALNDEISDAQREIDMTPDELKGTQIEGAPEKVRQDKRLYGLEKKMKRLASKEKKQKKLLLDTQKKLVEEFKKDIRKIMSQTKFMSSTEISKIDVDGGGIIDLCERCFGRDALGGLEEHDIECLRVWTELLSTTLDWKDTEKAVSKFEAISSLCKHIQDNYYPEDFPTSRILYDLANAAYFALGEEYEKAKEEFDKAKDPVSRYIKHWLRIDPTHYHLAKFFARNLWEVKDYEEAIQYNPYIAEYHFGKAEKHRKQKEWRHALKEYNKTIELASKEKTIRIEYEQGPATLIPDLDNEGKNYWDENRTRIEATNDAIEALSIAAEMKPGNIEYEDRLKKLKRRRAILEQFGEPKLNLASAEKAITVEMAPDIIDFILTDEKDDLSPKFRELIGKMRDSIQKDLSLRIPGISFLHNEDPDFREGTYIIRLAEVEKITGNLPAEENVGEQILQHLRSVIEKNQAEFIDFDEI